MPKFVFFGTGRFAVQVLENLKKLGVFPLAIVTKPDAPAGRNLTLTPPPTKIWAEENNVVCFQFEKLNAANLSKIDQELRTAELFIVSDYGKLIPESILTLPKYGTVITHQSLLPRHRGTSPIQYTILDGDAEAGVTLLIPDDQADHGKIVSQEKIMISGHETAIELEGNLAPIAANMIHKLLSNTALMLKQAHDQNHSEATFTKKIEKSDAFIDPHIVLGQIPGTPAIQAERMIRAFNPNPGTWTEIVSRNKPLRLKVLSAKVEDGTFIPMKVVPEGKKEMSWADFKRGNL